MFVLGLTSRTPTYTYRTKRQLKSRNEWSLWHLSSPCCPTDIPWIVWLRKRGLEDVCHGIVMAVGSRRYVSGALHPFIWGQSSDQVCKTNRLENNGAKRNYYMGDWAPLAGAADLLGDLLLWTGMWLWIQGWHLPPNLYTGPEIKCSNQLTVCIYKTTTIKTLGISRMILKSRSC